MTEQTKRVRSIIALLTVVSALFYAVSCASMGLVSEESEWIDLIEGDDLSGWTLLNGTGIFEVVDGAIIGRTPPEESPSSFLCTDEEYGDFELEFETRVDEGFNSGVQIRSRQMNEADAVAMTESMSSGMGFGGRPDTMAGPPDMPEAEEPGAMAQQPPDTMAQEPPASRGGGGPMFGPGRVFGPQVEIEPNAGENGVSESGYIFGEGMPQFWLTPDEDLEPHSIFKNGEWNQYRVIAQGPRIQVWVNGVQVSDFYDEESYGTHPSGFIGLQLHSIDPERGTYEVAWRNMRIRPLD